MDYTQALADESKMYNLILQGYQQREKNLGTNLEALGESQRRQASDYYAQQSAAADQSAISRGLANTTVRNSLQQGVNRQRDMAMLDINNAIAQQRLNYGQQWSGDILNYMSQMYGQRNQMDLARQQLAAQQQLQQQQLGLGYAQLAAQREASARASAGGGGGGMSLLEQNLDQIRRFGGSKAYGSAWQGYGV